MARTRFSSYLPDDDEESGVDRAISALSLVGSGESSDAGIQRFTDDDVDRSGQTPFGGAPDMVFSRDEASAVNKPDMVFSLQDASDGLFDARNKAMRDAGGSNSAVAHVIDPNDEMTPEAFERKARLSDAMGDGSPDPRSADKPVVEKTTVSLASPPDHVGALSEAFDKTGRKKPDAVVVDDGGGQKPKGWNPWNDGGKGEGGDSTSAALGGGLGNISGWALVADALLNRGRGVGQIAAMAQQQSAQERHDAANRKNSALEEDYKRAQITHLEKTGRAASDWEGDKSARDWEALRLREGSLGQSGERVDLAKNKFGQQTSADSDLNKTKVAVAGDVAGSAIRGREAVKHELNDQISGDAANVASARAGASTDARQDTEHENAPRTAADAAVQSGMTSRASAEAALPSQQTLKATPTPSELRTKEHDELAQSPLPGFEVVDDTANKKANLTPDMSEKNSRLISGGNSAIEALNRAIATQEKYPGRVAALERDPKVAQELAAAADDVGAAIGATAKANDLGVLNAGEYPRIAARIPEPGSWQASMATDGAINALSGSSKDSVLEKLKGARDAMVNTQNETLKLMGVRRAEPASPIAEGESNPGKLPVMKFDTRPDKVSTVIGQTQDSSARLPPDGGPLDISGTFDIQDPNGKVYTKTLSKDQLDAFLRANKTWSLVSP